VDGIYTPTNVTAIINSQTVLPTASSTGTFGSNTDYTIFANGNYLVQFLDPTTSGNLTSTNTLFELNKYYTVIGYNDHTAGTYHQLVLTDKPTTVLPNAQLRVVNVATGTGTVDVYVTASGADISGAAPTASAVAVADTSQPYFQESANTYEVRVTPTGTKTVIADQTITVTGNKVNTLVIMNDSAGHTVVTPLIEHQF